MVLLCIDLLWIYHHDNHVHVIHITHMLWGCITGTIIWLPWRASECTEIIKKCKYVFMFLTTKLPSSLFYKTHFSRQSNCWSLRCSWSIACRRCSNYIFILNLTPGFNGLGKDNCKMRRETFKFWNLLPLILETLRYVCLPFWCWIWNIQGELDQCHGCWCPGSLCLPGYQQLLHWI